MAKEIKGEDGKNYVVKTKKPWYKRWWVWVLVIVAVFIVIGAIAGSGDDDDSSDSSTSQTTKKNYVRLDGEKIYYTSSKKYKVNTTDTSWSAATAKVNSVTVYKTDEGYTYGSKRGHNKVQGMLAVNVTVKALKDIDLSMDSATISIPSINEQHDIETKDEWDDLDKGISKTGTLYAPIYKLSNVKDIKSLRFKFDAEQEDTDADDFDHTYDMNINLN
ncbi:hypothetical protein [Lactobacillus helveticus]|uniref:hypothetical protein n=1 Tax=Lactobacillus helveticus TaxID=1587 RepID=UPI0015625EE8|nr:hypothetical protein [Lactobacillus helveticus]NRO05396.1 hypothetical protein [Lactobacillus helveticus]